jgi:hypothetical protein
MASGERVITKAETERVHPSDVWRQGDLINIEHPTGQVGPQFGVVLNADCDLEHCKTDGAVAYLPLYPFRQFLTDFTLPAFIDGVVTDATKRIVDIARGGDTGSEDLEQLMTTISGPEVTAKLQSLEHVKKQDHSTIEEHVQRLGICRATDVSCYERFAALCRLQKDPAKYARAQIEHAKRTMGEGHFFLSEVLGLSDLGFVIRMRRIYSIPDECIFTSVSAQRSSMIDDQPTAVRFARLTPLYRFKVIQVFAHQFSRVGLPDEITALSGLAVDDLVNSITQGPQ